MQEFLSNESKNTFLDIIKKSLSECNSFAFSVSFIKRAGLSLLSEEIEAALKRGSIGKIITSTYQNFTDILSLVFLLNLTQKYTNFSCHLENHSFGDNGFHTKGYFFEFENYFQVVIGSSNITYFALKKNKEWNISLKEKNTSTVLADCLKEFNRFWDVTPQISEQLISEYKQVLEIAIERWDMDYIQNYSKITPNYMQRKALSEIRRYRDMGVNRALIIAATASGKTYLAAFDAFNFGAKKLLFIVHRDTVLHDAQETFSRVFGSSVTYGFFTGTERNIKRDFLFSTNTMMSTHLDCFSKDEFDYIVVDEVHHATADTYQKIINYFTPEFLLGLTATPERMDNESVFAIFQNNVPYELRLRDALLNDLVVPFKYFGIRDEFIDYSISETKNLLKQLSSGIHCDFISEKIHEYKPEGKLKAICFCRSIEHARQMATQMQCQGYFTTFLTGSNDTGERFQSFKDLQDENGPLEMIFTVDILNEGVDIPGINMVIFLRPTESSTIFIQQLGRGLRKYPEKKFLTVLDFIGNSYRRSVQIAIAMGSFNENMNVDKHLLCEYINDDFKALDLPIEINIDQKSKEEILDAIEKTNFNSFEFQKQEYLNLKKYLNSSQPLKHMNFLESDVPVDLVKIIKVHGCFYAFLCKTEVGNVPLFSSEETQCLEYVSSFLPLIRPDEFLIFRELLLSSLTKEELKNRITTCLGKESISFNHAFKNLQNMFYSLKQQETMPKYVEEKNNTFSFVFPKPTSTFIDHLNDLLKYGLERYKIENPENEPGLLLYGKYTRIQFLMSIQEETMAFREGIKWFNKELFLFVDLKKDLEKEEWLLYEDKFLHSGILQWESQTETTLSNEKGKKLINQGKAHVFVRKIQKEDGIILPYIYIGKGQLTNPRISNNTRKSLLFDINLENNVPHYLSYEFQIPEVENGKKKS